MRAYLFTCEERAETCALTVAALADTDWGSPPTVVVDESPAEKKIQRILETGLRVLVRAVDEAISDDEIILCCEDDVAFNRWLRHNLEHWAPVVERRADGHLFGSVYNPNVIPPPGDGAHAVVTDPRRVYGCQGMVMSITTARALVEQWSDGHGPLDLRISRLAARWSPIWYHVPSLVQHRPVASTWGGAPHHALDFSGEWRA